jgi:murein DD-endopeptidase MepM/ murein hydrolase activator NlpD
MLPKRFMIAVTDEEGDYFSTWSMTRGKLAVMAAAVLAACFVLVFFASFLSRRADRNLRSRETARKNELLERTFKSWETRVERLQKEVKDVQRRNHQLRTTAFLSLPDIEYGIGGPESSMKSGLMEFSETQPIDLDLNRIESEVRSLEASTAELENTIQTKRQEILHYPSIQPVRGGWLSSSFGKRIDPFTGKIEDHPGIDISIEPGSKVFASGAGIVKQVNTRYVPKKGYGIYIVIDHGLGYETLYGHLSKTYVQKGQQVKRWDLIGLSGDTGKSTAPHLHYGVSVNGVEKNPFNFLLEE